VKCFPPTFSERLLYQPNLMGTVVSLDKILYAFLKLTHT
jgi:hypothetical protein